MKDKINNLVVEFKVKDRIEQNVDKTIKDSIKVNTISPETQKFISGEVKEKVASVLRDEGGRQLNEAVLLKAEELKNLDLKRNLLPKGTIIAWYGQNLIPDGWVICDGNNGTPDLRNKFLRGGTIDQFGETEGKNWIIDGQTDGHKLTIAEIPAHDHNFQGNLDGGAQLHWFGSRPGARDPVPTITPGGGSVEMWKVGGNQPHFHTIQGHDNRPEFMSIVFIMKL